jgi:hypothetical protein
VAPRITRDYARLISMVKAVAILRHRHRRTDASRRLVTETADYEAVRALVADIYTGSQSGASTRIRAVVDAVAAIVAETGLAASVTAGVLPGLECPLVACRRSDRAACLRCLGIAADAPAGLDSARAGDSPDVDPCIDH